MRSPRRTKLAAIATTEHRDDYQREDERIAPDTFEQHRLDPIGGDERQHGTEYDGRVHRVAMLVA
jgi:hypothetical protein